MAGWLDVAGIDELTPGTRRVVDVAGVAVAVFNLGGEFFAIQDICPHDGGELANGKLEGDVIICPRPGARFSIKTGACRARRPTDVRTYPVELRGGAGHAADLRDVLYRPQIMQGEGNVTRRCTRYVFHIRVTLR
jgi:3-phenylpropionate/trans-cinnamate dioxygenase ferredoxin subunit